MNSPHTGRINPSFVEYHGIKIHKSLGEKLGIVWDLSTGKKADQGTLADAIDVRGGIGANGKNIEIQNNGTYIQWRVVGDTTWNNIVALSVLTGTNGETPQFRVDNNTLQYRFATQPPTTWTDLYVFLPDVPEAAGVPEAPQDGKTYGRKDADWSEVTELTAVIWQDTIIDFTPELNTVYYFQNPMEKINFEAIPQSFTSPIILFFQSGSSATELIYPADTKFLASNSDVDADGNFYEMSIINNIVSISKIVS